MDLCLLAIAMFGLHIYVFMFLGEGLGHNLRHQGHEVLGEQIKQISIMCISMCIYIYIYREREREKLMSMSTFDCISLEDKHTIHIRELASYCGHLFQSWNSQTKNKLTICEIVKTYNNSQQITINIIICEIHKVEIHKQLVIMYNQQPEGLRNVADFDFKVEHMLTMPYYTIL